MNKTAAFIAWLFFSMAVVQFAAASLALVTGNFALVLPLFGDSVVFFFFFFLARRLR